MSNPGIDISALVARSQTGLPSKNCWRSLITGDADAYMTEIEKLPYPSGVVGSTVFRILTEDLGVPDLNTDKVRSHLRGDCRCPRSKNS